MVQPTNENPSCCCTWFDRSSFDMRQQRCVAHITLLIISITTLAIAIFFTLISTGMLENYPLYVLADVSVFVSGILLTLSAVSTSIALSFIIRQSWIGNRNLAAKPGL